MHKGIFLAAVTLFIAAPRASVAQQTPPSQTQSAAKSQSPATAQAATQTDSIAEAARKAREAQKAAPKAAMVFTNDNIPRSPGDVSVVGNPAASESKATQNAAGNAGTSSQNGEAAWRKKFADARHKLEQDQSELSIMQRELSQLQLQYYPDPTKALMQSYNRSDILKKQQAIVDKQQQISADRQAISNLEDELRKAGGDPGWARE